ncbi:MAG: caspase family protein [Elusimicrobiota bacterium]|jgi:hypothetical protein|nr:caspase family protein [Elusimicrobiota bacterium]
MHGNRQKQVKKALCVGINSYPSLPLSGCIKDATCVSRLLEKNGDESPNFDVRLETDTASKSRLKDLISILFSGDCDTALFYFSGHGFINEIGGYIVTPDFKRYDEGVSMHEILILANESKIKDKIIILDCCHSGFMGNISKDANTASLSGGLSILTASKDTESAIEINGHGVFTNLLLEALNGGAADIRGHVTPGSVYAFIDQSLGPWDQRPVFKTNVTRFTSLRTVVPQVPTETLSELVKFFPSTTDKFLLDPSFEYTNSSGVTHKVIKPYATKEHVVIFKKLQQLQSVGLVVPYGAKHMYFAAMKSKACKLTALGRHYWQLVKEKRI